MLCAYNNVKVKISYIIVFINNTLMRYIHIWRILYYISQKAIDI